jgi:transcriptional regulator with XRE-family HTH domain
MKSSAVRTLRQNLKLRQIDLAEILGVSATTVSLWEAQGIPRHGAARRMLARMVREYRTTGKITVTNNRGETSVIRASPTAIVGGQGRVYKISG